MMTSYVRFKSKVPPGVIAEIQNSRCCIKYLKFGSFGLLPTQISWDNVTFIEMVEKKK